MLSSKAVIVAALALALACTMASAGTILLLGAGTGSPGGSPPAGCVGAADFGDGCAVAVFGH